MQILKKVNILYPSGDFDPHSKASKGEFVEFLLAEVNQIRKIDEQESITLDKNDLQYVEINSDLSIKVGVRDFITDDDDGLGSLNDDQDMLVEFRRNEAKS